MTGTSLAASGRRLPLAVSSTGDAEHLRWQQWATGSTVARRDVAFCSIDQNLTSRPAACLVATVLKHFPDSVD